MSKLVSLYNSLKESNPSVMYLFKSGMFYIFLDEDAKKINQFFDLKLTYFTPNIVKCGFPINSLEKYLNILKNMNYEIKIIVTSKDTSYSIKDYTVNNKTIELLQKISKIDIDNLSVKEAYDFIENIKSIANNILIGE